MLQTSNTSPLLPLPIDGVLAQISAALEKGKSLILQSSPGSGKTTRVPSHLLSAPWRRADQEILVLEPRRVAAKFAARRVASEMRVEVGTLVGYHFRFEKRTSAATRLCFLTEGMLLRRLIRDPELKGVACVILDEFHERHLHTDLAISYLKRLQETVRPDLKLVVMSATLDTVQVSQFLNPAAVIQLESKVHPIDCRYVDLPKKELAERVASAVRTALAEQSSGDMLVFLPGMREIRQCETLLAPLANQQGLLLLGLHGDLSREEQDRAIQKQAKRKIVLSTNIAESALTIEGLTCVIDSGLHRMASYSWWSGVPLLSTKPISKASGTQRMGRAGRMGPGLCLRLYSKHEWESRIPYETPEILRADLSQSVLELKSLGITELKEFPWYAAPSETALQSAEVLLIQLGALEPKSPHPITELGRQMVEISLHPRLSRFLIECKRRRVLEKGSALAALISEGALNSLDPFVPLERGLDPYLEKIQQQLSERFRDGSTENIADWHDELSIALLSAYPDRIALKRKTKGDVGRIRTGEIELQLSSGGSVILFGAEAASHLIHSNDYFIALEIQELKNIKGHSQLYARALCPIQEEWLFEISPSPLIEDQVLDWNKDRKELKAISQLKIGRIILDEKERIPEFGSDVFRLWLREAFRIDSSALKSMTLNDWIRSLGLVFGAEEVETALSRLQLGLRQGNPVSLSLSIESSVMESTLSSYLTGKRRVTELHWNELFELLSQNVLGDRSRELPRLLPSHISLPGGRSCPIHYTLDKAPWIESRLQDFYGMNEGPKLLNGKLPLTIHLLAPNYKAVQVTHDLSGFWTRTYPEVRKELGRKYPRHSWPDNPLTASPPPPKPKRR